MVLLLQLKRARLQVSCCSILWQLFLGIGNNVLGSLPPVLVRCQDDELVVAILVERRFCITL